MTPWRQSGARRAAAAEGQTTEAEALNRAATADDASPSGRHTALFAELLGNRPLARGLTALLAGSLAATASGLGGWICPLRAALGVPCPGRGLTRGAVALLAGDLPAALAAHPLAPAALLATLLLAFTALLPAAAHRRVAGAVRRLESAGPFDLLFALALLLAWALRLALPSVSSSSLLSPI